LYERGLEKNQIIKLFQVIDRMMTLPNQLQQRLDSKIKQFEEERTMPLLSNMEEVAMERGKEIGKEIGALQKSRDDIKTVVTVRFGDISSEIQDLISKIADLSLLEDILKLAVTVNSLEEFKQSLK
jgi:hypothetical protein